MLKYSVSQRSKQGGEKRVPVLNLFYLGMGDEEIRLTK